MVLWLYFRFDSHNGIFRFNKLIKWLFNHRYWFHYGWFLLFILVILWLWSRWRRRLYLIFLIFLR